MITHAKRDPDSNQGSSNTSNKSDSRTTKLTSCAFTLRAIGNHKRVL